MNQKLHLSKKNKVIAGVCGGLSESFSLDPTLVRVIWVVLSLWLIVPMVVLYIVCWAIMPQEL